MKKFKVAVAGCGWMSQEWIKYSLSRQDVEIVALMDINKKIAKERAKSFKLECGVYTDIVEAIKKSGANLVYDITPPQFHKHTVTTAVNLGCDVFGEKPMAYSMKEARKMVMTVQKSGKMYAITQNRRYSKGIRTLKGLINYGTIGKPEFICVDLFIGLHNAGFREIMKSPILLDMAIHAFDKTRFLLGMEPLSVWCYEFNPENSWYKGNAATICTFEFPGGLMFNYRGAWCFEGCQTSWDSSWRICGSKGTAIWDGGNTVYYEVVIPSKEKKIC